MEEYLNIFLKQLIVALSSGLCVYLKMRLKAKQAELAAKEADEKLRRKADRVMLRNTIRQACKRRIKDGWVELDEKGDILECYDVYEEIIQRDGITNGVIDDCIRQYRLLPNTPQKEDNNEH